MSDKETPSKLLQRRKNQIDKYIARMDRVGTKGEFYDSYVRLSVDFKEALKKLKHKQP